MLLGIDGTNWVHALWHAMGRQRSVSGVLDCLRGRIAAVASAAKASVVLVAFDRRSFRHDLLPQYKAQRPEHDAELDRALVEAPAAVRDGGVGLPLSENGFEADDLLATLAAAAVLRGEQATLCSPDRDLWQCLVDGVVRVLRGVKTERGQIVERDWFTAADLRTWPKKHPYGLRPDQWAEYQALVGESGDNVPGCPKWGEKTAGSVLVQSGSIAAMLAKPWNMACTRTQLAALQNWAKDPRGMRLALDCVRLRTDCESVWDALR